MHHFLQHWPFSCALTSPLLHLPPQMPSPIPTLMDRNSNSLYKKFKNFFKKEIQILFELSHTCSSTSHPPLKLPTLFFHSSSQRTLESSTHPHHLCFQLNLLTIPTTATLFRGIPTSACISRPSEILANLLTLNTVCVYMAASKWTLPTQTLPWESCAFSLQPVHLHVSVINRHLKLNRHKCALLASSLTQLTSSFPLSVHWNAIIPVAQPKSKIPPSLSLYLSFSILLISLSPSVYLSVSLPFPLSLSSFARLTHTNPAGFVFKMNSNSTIPTSYATTHLPIIFSDDYNNLLPPRLQLCLPTVYSQPKKQTVYFKTQSRWYDSSTHYPSPSREFSILFLSLDNSHRPMAWLVAHYNISN